MADKKRPSSMERQTTLTRLSKLQREIQQLTDALNPRSTSRSGSYSSKNTSQPTTRYTSELEAKYLGSSPGSINYASATRQPSSTSRTGQSWSSNRRSGNSGLHSNMASTSATLSANSASGYWAHGTNPTVYGEGKATDYLTTKSSSLSKSLSGYNQSESRSSSSFESASAASFPITRTISTDSGGHVSSTNRLREIEEKYLHHDVSSALTSPGPDLYSSHMDTRISGSGPVPWTRSWTSPKTTDNTRQVSHHAKPALSMRSSESKFTPKEYSWRQSPKKYFSTPDSKGRSETFFRSRSWASGQNSSAGGHWGPETKWSKYRFDARKTLSPSVSKHRHREDHQKPSSSHPAHNVNTSTKVTHSTPHSVSKPRAVASAFSSTSKSTPTQVAVSSRSYRRPSHRGSSSISSRGRGLATTRGYEYPRSRGQRFLSSRSRSFSTRRGRGFTSFRGRGTRGYRSSVRGRRSVRSRAGYFRGRGSSDRGSPTLRGWRGHRTTGYHGKGTSSSRFFTSRSSSKKAPAEGSFHSRYALRKSLGRSAQKKPLSFMEKRRQTVLSNTPVLLRSKYNLIKGHRSVIRPVPSRMSLSTPARKAPTLKRLVTVKNTKRKLIRRVEGDRRPSGSLVNLQGTQFKLRINRFSKVLYRIPSGTQIAPSGTHRNTPSTSKKGAETRSSVGRKLALKSTTPSITRKVASHVLHKSIHMSLAAKQRSKKQSSKNQYCMFYNLYGRCNRGDTCPYIHDPEKVAVCTRFLRGTCPKTDGSCLFSHKVSKEKMPVCSYFLRGVCNRDDCPYSHVKVSSKAIICPDFIRGYCPLGEKCKKKHVLRCVEFSKTGKCEKGTECPLLHKKDPVKSNKSRTKIKTAVKRQGETDNTDPRTPAKKAKQKAGNHNTPSFIKLSATSPAENMTPSVSETGEGESSMPSFIKVSSYEKASVEAPPLAVGGEGSGIIPSFVKLSSSDRAKEAASLSNTTEHMTSPQLPDDSTKTDKDGKALSSGVQSLPRDPSVPSTESQKSSSKKSSFVKMSPDDPDLNSREGPNVPSSIKAPDTKEEVMAPSSPGGEGSSTLPSFIELSPGDTPTDPMEDSTSPAEQEPQKNLRIRPHFLR